MKRHIVLGLAFIVALGAPNKSSGQTQQEQQLRRADQACNQALADSRISPLIGKVGMRGRDTTFSMLTNQNYPSESEKKAILAFAEAKTDCHRLYQDADATGPYGQQGFNAFTAILSDLYSGKITYGQFGKTRNDLISYYDELERVADEQRRANALRMLGILGSMQPSQPSQRPGSKFLGTVGSALQDSSRGLSSFSCTTIGGSTVCSGN